MKLMHIRATTEIRLCVRRCLAEQLGLRSTPFCVDTTHEVGLGVICRRTDRWRAKFELLHTVRTHLGASDANYGCVVQREDSTGKVRQNTY